LSSSSSDTMKEGLGFNTLCIEISGGINTRTTHTMVQLRVTAIMGSWARECCTCA
jgi:hypothetical protein